ncbi:MAG: hypothetical protein WD934_11855, partial [Gemmatimonadales bacterium]
MRRLLPVLAALAACTGRPATAPVPAPASGPLMIDIVYPRVRDTVPVPRAVDPIAARDSTFLFGSVGRGDAQLTVNGFPVSILANGAWLAWVPLPGDTVAQFDLVALTGSDTMRRTFAAALPASYTPPPIGPWVDTMSLRPRGDWWVRPAEGVRLAVRATPGAEVALVLADARRVPLVPAARAVDVPWGVRAFGVEAPEDTPPETDR